MSNILSKAKKLIIVAVFLAVPLLVLAAYGDSSNPLVGSWAMSADGWDTTWTFHENGNLDSIGYRRWDSFTEERFGTWEETNNLLRLAIEGYTETVEFEVDGDVLRLTPLSGGRLTLHRVN